MNMNQSVPQEVFDMVAQHLDWSELIQMTQVSWKVNSMVRKSSKFLRTTIFTVTRDNAKRTTEMPQRSYKNVIIDKMNILLARDSAIQFSGRLINLKLSEIIIVDVQDFFHLLNKISLISLENLEIDNVDVVDKISLLTQKNHLNMPNLIDLSVSSSKPEWILHFLKDVTKLSSLKICRTKDFKGKSDFLIKFINNLEALNCLHLTFINFDEASLSSSKLEPKLQLKELKLRDMPFHSPYTHSAIASMFQHGEHLTALGDCNGNLISNALLPVCFNTLKYLDIELGYILNENFLENLKNFDEVENLFMSGDFVNPRSNPGRFNQVSKVILEEVLSHFKYATHLQLSKSLYLINTSTDDQIISSSFIRKLTIDFFRQYVTDYTSLPNLEELEIIKFHEGQFPNLTFFLKNHRKIRKIKVHVLKNVETRSREIFKSLHALAYGTEIIEIFNGKKTYRMNKEQIELQEYGREFDKEQRKILAEKYEYNHKELFKSARCVVISYLELTIMEIEHLDKYTQSDFEILLASNVDAFIYGFRNMTHDE